MSESPLPPDERPPLAPLYLVTPGPVFRDDRLSDKAKFTYALLASVADHEGYCEPRVSRVAGSFHPPLSIRHARACLSELVNTGWLEREVRAGPMDPRASNRWRLTGPIPRRNPAGGRESTGGTGADQPGAPEGSLRVIGGDLQKPSSPSGGRPLSTTSTEFSPDIEEAVGPYLRTAHFPDRVRQEIQRALAPIAHGNAATPEQVITALHEMQANGVAHFHARAFRGYLTRAQEAPPPAEAAGPATTPTTLPRRGRAPGLGDRMAEHRRQLEDAEREEEG